MNEYLKLAFTGLIIGMIVLCIRRQLRYWRELTQNRPSGSVRAGYSIAFISIACSLVTAVYYNTPGMWNVFISVVMVAFLFCLKITFSPAAIGLTLAVCVVQLHRADNFPVMEVWAALLSIITWRLPEGVRACYAYFSFVWVLLVLLFPSQPAAVESGDALDAVSGALEA